MSDASSVVSDLRHADALPVMVVDGGAAPTPATLTRTGSGRLVLGAARPGGLPSLHIGPGWVDLHAHVFDGSTEIGLPPDAVGLRTGVHLLADAGTAGEASVRGLIDYVLPTARTEVLIWLNIGSHGLVHLREVSDRSFIDVGRTIAAVRAHPEIRGVKVRSSGLIVGGMGLAPLVLAKEAARACDIPVMVHIGEAPPAIGDVLDLLDAGDVVTHCFHGKEGGPWNDGEPIPALSRALDRGVLLDVGHGAASFGLSVAARAIARGYRPHTISTDVHVRNVRGPVHDLATVMTKLLHCGMPLVDVVRAVTTTPRDVLRAPRPWLFEGGIEHATVFTVDATAPAGRSYRDADGMRFSPAAHIVPRAAISGGRLIRCGD